MLSKPNIQNTLRLALLVGLLGYVVVALGFTSGMSEMRRCRGMRIIVNDSTKAGFVTSDELARELGEIYTEASGKRLSDISLDEIEQRLAQIDKIENVNAAVMTNDSIYVSVTPLVPAIRVFDRDRSYYVNSVGKRIEADARYTMDVPVVKGNFADSGTDPAIYIPLARTIDEDPQWHSLFSMIEVGSPDDIFLIPDIKGQVVAFGGLDDIEGKLRRLSCFYREVMPYKGWNFYDTISVKWDGQIVAVRAHKRAPIRGVVVDANDETGDYENLGLDELVDTSVLVSKPAPPPAPRPTTAT